VRVRFVCMAGWGLVDEFLLFTVYVCFVCIDLCNLHVAFIHRLVRPRWATNRMETRRRVNGRNNPSQRSLWPIILHIIEIIIERMRKKYRKTE